MLPNYQEGYSVQTRDLSGISFESQSLDDCKKYCREDTVIVKLTPVKCGFNLRIWYSKSNRGIKYDRYCKCLSLWKLNFQIIPEWSHKVGKVVYDPLKDK